jgi:hypothetical protein
MSSLATRFRSQYPRDQPPFSARRLAAAQITTLVRFVESRFDEQKTSADIQRLFGPVRDIQYRPLSLRAIFLALARKTEEV